MKKVVAIFGGTGALGSALTDHLIKEGYRINIISRQHYTDQEHINYYTWDGRTMSDWILAIENADVVINLAGKSVNCRYNSRNRKLIYDSRLSSTSIIGKAIAAAKNKPKIWLNASTATIYKDSYDQHNTEEKGIIGKGFSVDVAKKWEQQMDLFDLPEVRKVKIRTSIVLGSKGTAWPLFIKLTKLLLGGKQGRGRQMVSWIHEKDFVRAVHHIIETKELAGIVNVSSPESVTNKQFMSSVRSALKIPVGLPALEWMLKLGGMIIGTEPELILKSRWAYPKRLLDSGFKFNYPEIEMAAKDLIKYAKQDLRTMHESGKRIW